VRAGTNNSHRVQRVNQVPPNVRSRHASRKLDIREICETSRPQPVSRDAREALNWRSFRFGSCGPGLTPCQQWSLKWGNVVLSPGSPGYMLPQHTVAAGHWSSRERAHPSSPLRWRDSPPSEGTCIRRRRHLPSQLLELRLRRSRLRRRLRAAFSTTRGYGWENTRHANVALRG